MVMHSLDPPTSPHHPHQILQLTSLLGRVLCVSVFLKERIIIKMNFTFSASDQT